MADENIALLEFDGNPNIGLYAFVNNKFCLVGETISEDKEKEIESVLQVPVYKVNVLDTPLVGVFLAGNDEYLLVPESLNDKEIDYIKSIAQEHDVEVITLSHKINTFGNNFCMGDREIIANADYGEKFLQYLADKTNCDIILLYGDDLVSAGALCYFSNGGYFFSQELEEENFSQIPNKVKAGGSVNSGGIFVSSGIVGNDFGLLIGSASSTVEIQNITESLEYL